jgi:hypothetical protein
MDLEIKLKKKVSPNFGNISSNFFFLIFAKAAFYIGKGKQFLLFNAKAVRFHHSY